MLTPLSLRKFATRPFALVRRSSTFVGTRKALTGYVGVFYLEYRVKFIDPYVKDIVDDIARPIFTKRDPNDLSEIYMVRQAVYRSQRFAPSAR